jgi:tripartite ATP-independent transporter DctM subunit
MVGIIMFFSALFILLLGVPVAFSFGGMALLFVLISPDLSFNLFAFLPFRIYGIMQNFTLMAVPLFILMGLILEKSNMAKALLLAMGQLFGTVRGGLAVSVVLVGAILAASTGIVGASVVMMSVIALPIMISHGYSKSLSAGTIASAGTLGQIIPPSIVLIVLGDVMSVSVGDLFKGAVVPSMILVFLYIVYILIYAYKNPTLAPAMKSNKNKKEIIKEAIIAIIPPLGLMFTVLGTIFFGLATPTESASFGVLGALFLTLFNGTFSYNMLKNSLLQTLSLTGMIFMILIGATAFSLVFNELGGTDTILDFFLDDVASADMFILVSMVAIFVLGFFIDFIEISFIVVPIFVPIVEEFAIDPLWFALLVALNLQASFLTPPFGLALFFLKGSAKNLISSMDIYKGIIPYILLQLITLALIIVYPSLVLWVK